MRVIAIINSKGGVGKTTVCVHTGHALALKNKRTLIIDMDMQDNVRIWFNAEPKDVTLFNVLVEGKNIKNGTITVRDKLDILPSGGDSLGAVPFLLNLNNIVTSLPKGDKEVFKRILQKVGVEEFNDLKAPAQELLRYELRKLKKYYDYVLIDCSPSRTLLHTMATVAANHIMVPVSMEWLSVVGSLQVQRALAEVKENYKINSGISFVVPTFVDGRRNKICDEVIQNLKNLYGASITHPIRVNGNLSEAPSFGKTIFEMSDQRGVEDFTALSERVILVG